MKNTPVKEFTNQIDKKDYKRMIKWAEEEIKEYEKIIKILKGESMKKPHQFNKHILDGEAIVIRFNKDATYEDMLYQAITGLAKAGFSSEEEIINEWLVLLKCYKGDL